MYIIRVFTIIILLGQILPPVVVFANSESSIEKFEVVSSEEELAIENKISSEEGITSEEVETMESSSTEEIEITESSSEEEIETVESPSEEQVTSNNQVSTKEEMIADTGSSVEGDLELLSEKYGVYVSIIKDNFIWDSLDLQKNVSSSLYENQVFLARDRYQHSDGFNYLSLFDVQGELLGYIEESGVGLGNGEQGPSQNYNKFISINGNYNIWDSFEWENSKPGLSYQYQTFEARDVLMALAIYLFMMVRESGTVTLMN